MSCFDRAELANFNNSAFFGFNRSIYLFNVPFGHVLLRVAGLPGNNLSHQPGVLDNLEKAVKFNIYMDPMAYKNFLKIF